MLMKLINLNYFWHSFSFFSHLPIIKSITPWVVVKVPRCLRHDNNLNYVAVLS
jgi:hypothetical protein